MIVNDMDFSNPLVGSVEIVNKLMFTLAIQISDSCECGQLCEDNYARNVKYVILIKKLINDTCAGET